MHAAQTQVPWRRAESRVRGRVSVDAIAESTDMSFADGTTASPSPEIHRGKRRHGSNLERQGSSHEASLQAERSRCAADKL
jgi:hypothetical protein